MPLPVIEIRDLQEYTRAFATQIIARDAIPPINDPTNGYNLGIADGSSTGQDHYHSAYDFLRDQVIFYERNGHRNSAGTINTGLPRGVYARDALCRNASAGWFVDTQSANPYLNAEIDRFGVGYPDAQSGQNFFYGANFSGGAYSKINFQDGAVDDPDAFPNMGNDWTGVGIATGVAGFFTPQTTQQDFDVLIFEGLVDSSAMLVDTNPVESARWGIQRGNNLHARGLAIMPTTASNFLGGSNLGARWTWVDLESGEAVGTANIERVSSTGSTNNFAGATLGITVFNWDKIQFVPDPDSLAATPKGEIHIMNHEPSNVDFQRAAQIDAPNPADSFAATLAFRTWVKVFDFNPFNLQTGTVRVDGRQRFAGLIQNPMDPLINGGGSADGSLDNVNNFNWTILYHPPSRSYISVHGKPETNQLQEFAPLVGNSRIIRWRRAVVIDGLTKPTAETAITQNRDVRFRILATNDFRSAAVGAAVDVSQFRLSTRDEQFDGTAQGASAYVVDRGVIDIDGFLEVRSAGGVDDVGGTLLAETLDYTVNGATGTLTPVGSWPTETIHIRYRHRSAPVAGGHGTLLTTQVTTDEVGQSFIVVRYGDNVSGEIERLQVTA